jgi:hypothetical protein
MFKAETPPAITSTTSGRTTTNGSTNTSGSGSGLSLGPPSIAQPGLSFLDGDGKVQEDGESKFNVKTSFLKYV